MATINYFDRLPDELLVKIFKDASRYSEDNDDDDDKRQEEEYTNEYFDEHVWCERSYTYTVLNILCWTCKRFNNVINYSLLNDDEFGLDVGRLSARPINSILPSPFKKFDWRKFAQHHYERNASDYPTVYYRANASEEHENSIWNYTRSHYSPVQRREGFYEDEEWEGEPGYILPLFYTRSCKRCDLDGLKVKPPHWCHYTNEPYCECRYERKRLAQCKLKYRYLEFTEIDLTRNCFPKFIQDKLTNLEFVTKLMIWDCNLDLAALKNILIWLPRVEKLSISRWSTYHSDARPYGWILNEDSPTRTLDYLHILPGNQNERCMIDPVVINVPAKIIDANVYPSEENLNLIRRYLVRYKTIIEHFRITLSPFNDSLCWHEFFEGFNVNSVLNEFEELEITTLHLNVDKLFKFSLEWHHEVQYDDSDK